MRTQVHASLPAILLASPLGLPLVLQLYQGRMLLGQQTALLLPATMADVHVELAQAARTPPRRAATLPPQPGGLPLVLSSSMAEFTADLADWMLFATCRTRAPGRSGRRARSSSGGWSSREGSEGVGGTGVRLPPLPQQQSKQRTEGVVHAPVQQRPEIAAQPLEQQQEQQQQGKGSRSKAGRGAQAGANAGLECVSDVLPCPLPGQLRTGLPLSADAVTVSPISDRDAPVPAQAQAQAQMLKEPQQPPQQQEAVGGRTPALVLMADNGADLLEYAVLRGMVCTAGEQAGGRAGRLLGRNKHG